MPTIRQALLHTDDIPFIGQLPPATSPKQMIAYQIVREMARQQISRVEMATRMGTSRAQLNRLLDQDNPSVTLQSIEKAATALGLALVIKMESRT